MKHFHGTVQKAKKLFPSHKWLRVKVARKPYNPYNNLTFAKIIKDSKDLQHTQYAIYVHDSYLCIKSLQLKNFEAIRMPLDSKLWFELYFVFTLDKTEDDNPIWTSLTEK